MRYTERATNGEPIIIMTTGDDWQAISSCIYRLAELEDKIESGELVDVVLCRDCVYYEKKQSHLCDMHNRATNDYDYCSYRVRK